MEAVTYQIKYHATKQKTAKRSENKFVYSVESWFRKIS